MSRRTFLKSLTALVGGFTLPSSVRAKPNSGTSKILQHSPVAGFQHHQSEALWPYHTVRPELVEG
jgi:hypothetical protein